MNRFESYSNRFIWAIPLVLSSVIAGCGGQDAILGSGVAALAPTVNAAAPADNATDISVHNAAITVTFDQAMAPIAGTSSFVVSCAAPCVNPTGTVALDSSATLASFSPASNLQANTLYTATVTGAKSLDDGVALKTPYIWHFTTGAAPAPVTVTAVAPTANSTNVAINNTAISVNFNEEVAPLTGAASFAVTCALPCINPTGTVDRDGTHKVATFTLAPATLLTPLTVYTATVTGARSLATGATLAAPVSWIFTTGSAVDATRPRVASTVPATTAPGPTVGVPANMAISAAFSENIAPASVSNTSFTVTCTAPCINPAGSVSYIAATRTAVFTPTAALAVAATYTVRITTAVTDLAGNTLAGNQAALPAASDYLWTFTTAAAAPAANVSIASSNPADNSGTACPGSTLNATFNVPSGARMDPASINTSTVILSEAATPATYLAASSVVIDPATGQIATFDPLNDLIVGTTYTATVKGGAAGVKDWAIPANAMVADLSWDFTVANCAATPAIVITLGSAETFGSFGGSAGTTNQGILTIINGDIGTTAASTSVTGFHDGGAGCIYTETPLNIGTVNGMIYTSAPPPTVACPTEGTAITAAIAAAARADALIAYNQLVAQPAGPDAGAGNLANLVLAPGVYTSASGSFMIQGGDLTLDAQGDSNAVWVFQMSSTLTVGGPGAAAPQSIVLVNGAQAKNIFWQVGTAATINAAGGGTMAGTIISQAGADISTGGNIAVVTLNGRVLSLNASVTMVNTVVNVPQ